VHNIKNTHRTLANVPCKAWHIVVFILRSSNYFSSKALVRSE